VEIHVDGTLFSLHVNPYFLRLKFPGDVQEDDSSHAKFDPSSGTLIVKLSKCNKGEDFPGLDLLSKLLAPLGTSSEPPVIEVLGQGENLDASDADIAHLVGELNISDPEIQEAVQNDWQLPQELQKDEDPALVAKYPYGFLDLYTGYLQHIHLTENEVNELGDAAETSSSGIRRKLREKHENEKFDEDYYMADFMDDQTILEVIEWKHTYKDAHSGFSEKEQAMMLRLPRKEYLVNEYWSKILYNTLVSILFAFCYENRSNMNDPSSESAWTISALIPAFTALDVSSATSLKESLRASYRRALAFPLYRSWKFCERCKLDVADILEGGTRTVLKYLLATKSILDQNDVYYVYSKIWLDDYCVWIQQEATGAYILSKLSKELRTLEITKNSIEWSLIELEMIAEERVTDSDDESEDEIEKMTPAIM